MYKNGVRFVIVSATEFKNKVGKYLKIAQNEEVVISKNGKCIAKLIAMDKDEYPATASLVGVFDKAASYDVAQTKDERLKKHESID